MKKKICLFFTLLLATVKGFAQEDYVPMLVEGKTWYRDLVCFDHMTFEWVPSRDTSVICGDTIINDLQYMKLYKNGRFSLALREEDKRVYGWYYSDEMMLYDFNMKVGDYVYYDEKYTVTNVFTIEAQGKSLKCIELTAEYLNKCAYWIEGVGGLEGVEAPFYPSWNGQVHITLDYCGVGDEVLYTRVNNPTAISLPSVSTNYDRLFDLQGRPINGSPKRGIYVKNGKKWINLRSHIQ